MTPPPAVGEIVLLWSSGSAGLGGSELFSVIARAAREDGPGVKWMD